jgi:hypothetical protein
MCSLDKFFRVVLTISVLAAGAAAALPAWGQIFHQQGQKFFASDAMAADQAWSVALSADGNTALISGPFNNNNVGGAWVFTRSNGVWTKQSTLVVSDAGFPYTPQLGWSVALSADGNTAVVGGPADTNSIGDGAAWLFTRTGGVWTQLGPKLVGTGSVVDFAEGFYAHQGSSVAISEDGKTILVGGYGDNKTFGAVWVFSCANGVCAQQGPKLVPSDAINLVIRFGYSLALSGDGNTAIIGAPYEKTAAGGAAWVFTRSGGTSSQQGTKLFGTSDVAGLSQQGWSVGLSADGNTAIIGGPAEETALNTSLDNIWGAAWVFVRSGSVWSQQGPKLVGFDGGLLSFEGTSVALSGDGNTAILGGPYDGTQVGAAWIFERRAGVWSSIGPKLVGAGVTGTEAWQGHSVALAGDGTTALVGGPTDNWPETSANSVGAAWPFLEGWMVAGVGRFNADTKTTCCGATPTAAWPFG